MFLSFIVTVYNTQAFLEECLQSLLKQDIATDDYEIICINDGSTDESIKILQMYQSQYCNNMTIIDEKNKGVAAARNRGLNSAHGEYVWFIDSDDFIEPYEYSGRF